MGTASPLGAPLQYPQILVAMIESIDPTVFDRKVMSMNCCLTMARVYHDQSNFQRVEYYADLAEQYLRELLDETLRRNSGVAAK